jgi:N6-L-threonylcarbamoyladenine synthase
MHSVNILAIESSCDDTSAAIIIDGQVRSNITASQEVHRLYGGVVPELASRQHLSHIIPVIAQALEAAGIQKSDLSAIAFTRGPGLLGSLIVGVSTAKSMALALNIPLIEVHHMQAHVMAHFAEDPKPTFPFLCLTVSGGHTQIVLMHDFDRMEVIGTTIDDAAGEAFDKTGKMLGLPYPAGPIIDALAKQGKRTISFPMPQVSNFDFSFSGLKTSILYHVQKEMKTNPRYIDEKKHDICRSVQDTIIDILMHKLKKAAIAYNICQVGIAGGVSANSGLRNALEETGKKLDWKIFIPPVQYCTDNAGMIGVTAYYRYLANKFADQSVCPKARLEWE